MDGNNVSIISDLISQVEKINAQDLMHFVRPIISIYITHKVINSYVLHKTHKPKNISKVKMPPELTQKYDEININEEFPNKYKESLLKFSKVLIENFPKEYLVNFYNNINELVLKQSHESSLKEIFTNNLGTYDEKKNKIVINDCKESVLFHELFHMASSANNKERQVGFTHGIGLPPIGTGINEGYTELLTRRYFKFDEEDQTPSYFFNYDVAKNIESLIGKERMEELYLKSDLMGLINELKKYATEDEIMKFINDNDFVVYNTYKKGKSLTRDIMYRQSLAGIKKFEIRTYIRKIKEQYEKGELEGDISTIIANYIATVHNGVIYRDKKYLLFTKEDISEIAKEELTSKEKQEEIVERSV